MLTLDCHTIREIAHQPKMWRETFGVVSANRAGIQKFFAANGLGKDTRIVLTGAGTSAFVADTAVCLFMQDGFSKARSVATTDIVSAPHSFLSLLRPFRQQPRKRCRVSDRPQVLPGCPSPDHYLQPRRLPSPGGRSE